MRAAWTAYLKFLDRVLGAVMSSPAPARWM
jgi:hypothetical protein